MKTLFATCFTLAGLLALAGCESVADVPVPEHTPRLSVAYTLSTRPRTALEKATFERRDLYVSTSHSITEISRLVGRGDASAKLYDASGQVVEEFRSRALKGYTYNGVDSIYGYYVPARGYVGQPGQRYTLRTSAPGVDATEATITLPAPATVEAGSYVPDATSRYQFQGRLAFTIVDNPATADYYLAYARLLDANGEFLSQLAQDYSSRNSDGPDIRLNRFDLSSPGFNYQTLPISDVGRNGQRLTFSNDVVRSIGIASQSPPVYLEVIVSSIPVSTYEFYQSIQRYYDTEGSPFAEPAPLRSNITGGYGLFAGATDTVLRIKL